MIVTIDGPAGAGKSTVTQRLAKRLGFQYLDTGAMYRAVTYQAMQTDTPLTDPQALADLARSMSITFADQQVLIDGQDVTDAIRENEVTKNVVWIADAQPVREILIQLQRSIADRGNYVTEGRDQGTVAFPDATCKIFLTASETQRAQRRVAQLADNGQSVDLNQILQEQQLRDRQDSARKVGRLHPADDAIEFNTDNLTIDRVVEELVQIINQTIS